jgi:hypothetical protein
MSALILYRGSFQSFFRHEFWNLALLVVWVAAVSAWSFLHRISGLLRSIRATSWPTVPGRIETAQVNAFGQQSFAELGYSYVVKGDRFSGYFTWNFADEQEAWDYANRLQGKQVVVRYMRGNSEVSVLRISDQLEANIKGSGAIKTLWAAFCRRIPAGF